MKNMQIPKKGIVLISGPKCSNCKVIKNVFIKYNISFTIIDREKENLRISIPQLYKDGELVLFGGFKNNDDLIIKLKTQGILGSTTKIETKNTSPLDLLKHLPNSAKLQVNKAISKHENK
jgi:hypothetical protein